jgi:ketosteroid isomerase-like protein
MTDRAQVSRWLAEYEAAWRSPGTARLAKLFTEDVTYRQSPYEEAVAGLEAVGRMWDAARAGPDEGFTLATSILAVDGDTAVVRAEVHYTEPEQEYRDLWIIQLAGDGRCRSFEEWPYWPGRPYTAGGAAAPGAGCGRPGPGGWAGGARCREVAGQR